jgi:DNA replicative helicase MCM subunit Mcm2 (Cdc46/Mcm family)
VGQLQAPVLAAALEYIKAIQKDLTFVDFSSIQDYAGRHPRAARYLASIRAQKEMKNIDKHALEKLCKNTGVEIQESNGKPRLKTAMSWAS